jgi:hypothetical protein
VSLFVFLLFVKKWVFPSYQGTLMTAPNTLNFSFNRFYLLFGHFPKFLLFQHYFFICFQGMFDDVSVNTLQMFS